ncbi:MAG: hypothetical protein KBG15_00050 [Kofleriaceae bacterium]|nr:hypothetical protein [Kofleriaceae bacterium]
MQLLKLAKSSSAQADAVKIVELMREYPGERNAMMTWLHQHRGNSFVQQVTQQMGQVERELPAGVDLKEVRGSFAIPGGRMLAGSWKAEVKTSGPTTVEVAVGHAGVSMRFWPGLFIDAQWPLQNLMVNSATYTFGDSDVKINAGKDSGLGSGMISIRDNVTDMLSQIIMKAVGGKAPAVAGYNPIKDANLESNLRTLIDGVAAMFTSGGDKAKPGKMPVATSEMKGLSAGATVHAQLSQSFGGASAGLTLDANSEIEIDADGAGSAADVLSGGTLEESMTAASLQSIRIRSRGLCVMMKGEPAVRLHSLTVMRGGAVVVGRMELLGSLKASADTESGLSALAGLLALATGSSAASGLFEHAQNPHLVSGVARKEIERQFTSVIHSLVMEYRGAVPGVDLVKVLGL